MMVSLKEDVLSKVTDNVNILLLEESEWIIIISYIHIYIVYILHKNE